MHYAFKDMEWIDLGKGWSRASVTLESVHDSAVNPTSSKPEKVLRGPSLVTYDRSPNGITVYVEDLPA